MVTQRFVPLLLAVVLGCSDGASDVAPPPDAAPPEDLVYETLTHRFDSVHAESGQEIWNVCQSWSLGNEEPLYVTAVRQRNDGGWHHSNWFYVTPDMFDGPDGTWPCSDRNFNEVAAGFGGGVFFAQSTQAREEEQRFPEGFAIRLPPHARIAGGIHILNTSGEAFDTALEFEVDLIAEEDVVQVLQPMSFTNMALNIPPYSRSTFTMECNFIEPTDFDMHYVLAHYHEWGELLRLEVMGGQRDGETLYETTSATGEPVGMTLDPPFEIRGATGLRLTCGYENDENRTIRYGLGGQEMCVFLAYLTGGRKYGGVSTTAESTFVGEEDGVQRFEAPCAVIGTPGN
jgi:hypothetical protein